MRRVLILTDRYLHNGPRIIREIEALKEDFCLWAHGRTPPTDPAVEFLPGTPFYPTRGELILDALLRRIRRTPYWSFLFPSLRKRLERLIAQTKPDLVIVHEPDMLPYLSKLKKKMGFKILYNAHEYHPLQFDSDRVWLETKGEYYHRIYTRYLRDVDLLVNVCSGIADKCLEVYGKKSLVVPNACRHYHHLSSKQSKDGLIRMIHHGAAIRGRELEKMIEIARCLGPRYHLDLMLTPNQVPYLEELRAMVATCENVNLLDPVAFDEIVPFINQYDIGLYYLSPQNFNQNLALPNKLFEYIQARLCIVITPTVEMKKLVEAYQVGVVAKDFSVSAVVERIKELGPEEICGYKTNCDKVAEELSAERSYEVVRQRVLELFAS